jgi:hypothetical protein
VNAGTRLFFRVYSQIKMWDWVRLDQGVLLFYRDRLSYLYGFQVVRLFVFSLDISVSRHLYSDRLTTCQLSLKKVKPLVL